MTKISSLLTALFLCLAALSFAADVNKPWDKGKLQVSSSNIYLKHSDGTPFFWMGNTAWLLPHNANREEVKFFMQKNREAGFNVIQVQVINSTLTMNVYGQMATPDGWNFEGIDHKGVYGFWNHMDFIIDEAAKNGIYIAMVCAWGNIVKDGFLTKDAAVKYGTFLANRYKDRPNIVWIMGGDILGDVNTEVWNTLASAIKSIDKNHLMTFHPRGRTSSATWFNNASWLDFNMFQSGHRRYGQRLGDKDYPIDEDTEEDTWQYVTKSLQTTPLKPVLDGEPAYEDIPQGLHNASEPHWMDCDARRYAYWSVFAGSFGHTYGHNAIMQFLKPGYAASYGDAGDVKAWYQALNDPGFNQMKYLKELMSLFPLNDRVPDQTIAPGATGKKYNRLICTRGKDYMLVYNYTCRSMQIDFRKIQGERKAIFWMDAKSGRITSLGVASNKIHPIEVEKPSSGIHDGVLIVFDASMRYLPQSIANVQFNVMEAKGILSQSAPGNLPNK